MNNITHKKEYSEQDIEKILKETSCEIHPSNAFMSSLLESLPERKIKSPYVSDIRSFFTIKKISFVIAVFVLMALGTTTYILKTSSNQPLPSSSENNSINTQISTLDAQINLLDNDNSTVDQSLH